MDNSGTLTVNTRYPKTVQLQQQVVISAQRMIPSNNCPAPAHLGTPFEEDIVVTSAVSCGRGALLDLHLLVEAQPDLLQDVVEVTAWGAGAQHAGY